MAIFKLVAGKPLILDVERAKQVEGQFGPQVAFEAGEDVLFVSLAAAQRQLERMGLDIPDAAGLTLRFEKIAKAGKTFVNIDKVAEDGGAATPHPQGGPSASVAKTPVSPTATPSPAAKPESRDVTYLRITDWMLREVAPRYAKAGIPLSPEAAAACVHTIWIDTRKHG